tara:strand:+ start:99 stop:959 length:861 start_codon:yes stop_codon:yes gene_type:complete
MSFDLSFIVATYRREFELSKLLKSIKSIETKFSYEIIVIDQDDSFKVKDLCQKFNAKYTYSKKIGLSISRNVGIKLSTGTFIALMDDDAILPKNYFINLNELILQNFSVFSGRIMTIENKTKSFSRYQGDRKLKVNYTNFDTILSTSLVFKKEIVNSVGFFDENFGVGAKYGASEETDFVLRILKENIEIFYYPSLIVLHPSEKLSKKSLNDIWTKSWNYSLGRGALIRKHKYLPFYIKIKNLVIIPVLKIVYGLVFLNYKIAISAISSLISRNKAYIKYNNKIIL